MLREDELCDFLPEEMNDDEEEEDVFAEDEDKILSVIRRTLHIESALRQTKGRTFFHIGWRSYMQLYCGHWLVHQCSLVKHGM